MTQPTGPDPAETFAGILRRHASCRPDAIAFVFLPDGEREQDVLTYGELDRQARSVAWFVRQRAPTGARAILLYPNSIEFIIAFFGCLYAGVVPVPVAPLGIQTSRAAERLSTIVEDADARLLFASRQALHTLMQDSERAAILSRLMPVAVEDVPAAPAEAWCEVEQSLQTQALLQYTAGSESVPKGVCVSHGNLVANAQMTCSALSHSAETVMVSWLPVHHDMGLIGCILQPVFAGCRCILMPTSAFLKRPMRWLQTIGRYRGETSGGPNFAYELCLRAASGERMPALDLSCWSAAFNGAEPVRAQTLDAFAERFAAAGFRRAALWPCYGLAEATLFVSARPRLAGPLIRTVDAAALESRGQVLPAQDGASARSLVSVGRSWLDEEIRIVQPETRAPVAEGRVGEIWVRGQHIAAGYWKRPEATAATFGATVLGEESGEYLRTGDLGVIIADELYVVGRIKDVIIIRGSNHSPQHIEATAEQADPAFRHGTSTAFSVADDTGEERLIVVLEGDRTLSAEAFDRCASTVREQIARLHGLELHAAVLVRRGSIPKTASGKVRRAECKARYLAGTLQIITVWPPGAPPVR